jgi:hypothetical protein
MEEKVEKLIGLALMLVFVFGTGVLVGMFGIIGYDTKPRIERAESVLNMSSLSPFGMVEYSIPENMTIYELRGAYYGWKTVRRTSTDVAVNSLLDYVCDGKQGPLSPGRID